MPNEQPSPEELERLTLETIAARLRHARTERDRDLLQKALDDPANRQVYLDELEHGGRHHEVDDAEG